MDTLDLTGLRCPLPALKVKRHLSRARPGRRILVLTDDPLAGIDVPHAVREAGGTLEAHERAAGEGGDIFTILSGGGGGAQG